MKTPLELFAACRTGEVCLDRLPHTRANESLVTTSLSIAMGIAAAISVLFVAIGAIRYILSQGEPQAVSKAKATIVYALIGLAVSVTAQAIIIFAVNRIAS